MKNYAEPGRYELYPKEISLHDDWDPWTSECGADLSLLEFELGFIHFNFYVQPICLWNSEREPSLNEVFVAGWGKRENTSRHEKNVPFLFKTTIESNEKCFLETKSTAMLESNKSCCADSREGYGVCTGDSGGGLFTKVDGVYHLIGVVASPLVKDVDCNTAENVVYNNALGLKDWVTSITGADGIKLSTHNELHDLYVASAKKLVCTFDTTDTRIFYPHQMTNIAAAKKVFCRLETNYDLFYDRQMSTCKVNQSIDSKDYFLRSPENTSIEKFNASDNRQVKFLPRHIGKKLPNLIEFSTEKCGLTVVHNFYFKDMERLNYLNLFHNQITLIESSAFRDLVNVERLILNYNLIQALDEKLFDSLVNLENIYLQANRIKYLSPTTFKIPRNEKLGWVDLHENFCVDEIYSLELNLNQLEVDIRANCTKEAFFR